MFMQDEDGTEMTAVKKKHGSAQKPPLPSPGNITVTALDDKAEIYRFHSNEKLINVGSNNQQ